MDIAIVGGAGHVGLPLGLVFVKKGLSVLIYDINQSSLDTVSRGQMPFMEKGGEELLAVTLKTGRLHLSADPRKLAEAKTIIITIGTPIDEFMNPDTRVIKQCVDALLPNLKDGQLIVLRSTIYPGTTHWLDKYLESKGRKLKVAFCPERVVQGHAIEEVQKLPQIVSGCTPESEAEAAALFSRVAPSVVKLAPMEAEFAKLFNNAYRYIQFATTNQFYMIANSAGVDYEKVLKGMKTDYPRAGDIPTAGFAAGPCLYKDTMQLAAFSDNQFSLGHAAMIINEGLILYVVGQIEKKYKLAELTVGLLGMAFKANSDDTRSSLSYKLKKVLAFHCKDVLTADPHVVTDPEILPLDEVVRRSDLLILCVPHTAYKKLSTQGKPLVDIWGFSDKGVLV